LTRDCIYSRIGEIKERKTNMNEDTPNCGIKRKVKSYNSYTMTFKGMTRGMILALHNALIGYSECSAVANDVKLFLESGIEHSNDIDLIRDVHLSERFITHAQT
jgi:hypothetical protein